MTDEYDSVGGEGLVCRHCGGKLEFVRSIGPTDFCRCMNCGREQAFHVVPPVEEFYRALGPRGTLKVMWRNEAPEARDAWALRQLVPDLKDLSVRDVLDRIRGTREWPFEELTSGMAEELKQRAVSLGLRVSIEFPK
jgi:hypothetical protein